MLKEVADRADRFGEVIFEVDVHVSRDRVLLRMRQTNATCLLERQLIRRDGATFTQVLSIDEDDTLLEFVAADPYADHLRAQYQCIDRLYREQLANRSAQPESGQPLRDPLDEICHIRASTNEGELMKIMGRVVPQLGGRSYTYRWLHVPDRTRAITDQRCLIGCHPGWMHAYISQQWYRKDPSLDYALRNSTSTLASDIEALGDDHRAKDVAARYGFRSAVVCPVHRPSGTVIGLLQIGNGLPQPEGERVLWQDRHRVLMRALADEVLNWHIDALRDEEASRVALDKREQAVLRLVRAGRTACNVADTLGVSERTVYDIFQKINRKLGVSHITRAVAMAIDKGLLD
ncbi:helix-turn-helix transcriptional regulator [Paraburkholderia terrae]|nr:LuxR family transcriptional regulator [Paraburkholderia terrae]